MNLLAIDRSTDVQSVALAAGGDVVGQLFEGADARSADWPVKVQEFLAGRKLAFRDIDRIVVGTGPGSFAGIRGALAFAQGLAIGKGADHDGGNGDPIVYGLPSAVALAEDAGLTAVVGDARRGSFWVVVYDGAKVVADFRLVQKDGLVSAVPASAAVATPDALRIGSLLEELFGARFVGGRSPVAERLARIAIAHPELLAPEPLPVYLSPAVRT